MNSFKKWLRGQFTKYAAPTSDERCVVEDVTRNSIRSLLIDFLVKRSDTTSKHPDRDDTLRYNKGEIRLDVAYHTNSAGFTPEDPLSPAHATACFSFTNGNGNTDTYSVETVQGFFKALGFNEEPQRATQFCNTARSKPRSFDWHINKTNHMWVTVNLADLLEACHITETFFKDHVVKVQSDTAEELGLSIVPDEIHNPLRAALQPMLR